MKSPISDVRKAKKDTTTLSLYKRIFLVFLACCIQAIYIPTSFKTVGGIEPKLPIDIFPIWPIWVVPYVLCHPLWFFGFTWIILKMEDRLFRATVSACFLTFSIGTLTFIFFPTFVKAATLEGNNIFVLLLRFIHENWGRYDAFPSGHVYITTLLALFYSRWYPHRKFLWISIVIIISLSTLFTGQHYIIDVVGGFVVAFAGYHFGWWWVGLSPTINRLKKHYSPPFIPD
jgi:membrane-associated phospholipid phosphatase